MYDLPESMLYVKGTIHGFNQSANEISSYSSKYGHEFSEYITYGDFKWSFVLVRERELYVL